MPDFNTDKCSATKVKIYYLSKIIIYFKKSFIKSNKVIHSLYHKHSVKDICKFPNLEK